MKNKIAGILILILLIVSILPSYVYCDDVNESIKNAKVNFNQESFNRLYNEGKANKRFGGQDVSSDISLSFSMLPGGANVLGTIVVLPFMAVQGILSAVLNGNPLKTITIKQLVFNESDLLNANYTESSSNIYNNFTKTNVMKWFVALRNLAAALSLIMLIYIGIRMVITSIASEKAKYKKMLIDWAVSFAVIFLIQFIIVIAMAVSDTIVELFSSTGIKSFESLLSFDILLGKSKGWTFVAIVILYMVIVFYQFKFFLLYAKRFLVIGFLIVISPLITITYAVDKAKDNKSQIFDTWLREFIGNVFIQPLHAGIYLIFIGTANNIFTVAPFLSVIMFMMLSRTERVVKKIFGMKKMKLMRDMKEVLGK